VFCGAVLTLAAAWLYLDPHTPNAESFRNVRLETPLRIYARDGELLAEFGERRTIPVKIDAIPADFINAVVSIEDKRFYEHSGIDLVSMLNDGMALLGNLITGEGPGAGASTITMQLARNVTFGLERTFIRKFKEMLLALKIERELSKQEILELYINVVPFGKRAYGAEAGARTYYGKSLSELDLHELALLAGIPQRPTANNPINGPTKALARRDVVLLRMFEQDAISATQYEEAIKQPLTARLFEPSLPDAAPYAAEWIRQQLITAFPDLYTAGYEVHTTIDARLQKAATAAVRGGLEAYDRRHGYRGAEARLDDAIISILATRPEEASELARESVRGIAADSELEAAAVLAADDETAELIITDGERVNLTLDDVKWARPYLNVDAVGAAPSRVNQVLGPGDIVRIRKAEERWVLAQKPRIEGALVSLEPDTGRVLAMSGGYDFALKQFNHATQAARQPGSGFKPFVYAAALANGRTPATTYLDAPLVLRGMGEAYRPKNSDNKFNGPTRLRQALYRSINLVTIRVLLDIGAGNMIEYAKGFGFPVGNFPRNTQLAVGGGTMTITPMEMARAYAVFANGGYLVEPWGIDRLVNAEGINLIHSHPPAVCHETFGEEDVVDPLTAETTPVEEAAVQSQPVTETAADNALERVVSPSVGKSACLEPAIDRRIAYIMNDMLKDVVRRGTARRALSLKREDLAGKTGTTDEAADTWFNGYSPDVATTVWVGFTELEPLGKREFGATTPLPIWIDYMKVALDGVPERFNEQPEGLVNMRVGGGEFEYFLAESTPRQRPVSTESAGSEDSETSGGSAAPVPVEDTSSIQSTDLF